MSENRLANATSPYLLQHKSNPVHWYEWGDEALADAKRQNKPILLSVGYAACHWCHVMAHESFEDESTADVMNELFINIKVDREERPDIDQIYMSALHALGEQGGWPLTMFLTPDAEPFWGGTYFPKESRWGKPSFRDALHAVHKTFHEDKDRIDSNTQGLIEAIKTEVLPTAPIDASLLGLAGDRLLSLFDKEHGGIKGAPKFPQASVLDFLWRYGLRSGNENAKAMYLHTLRKICNGGIYDHLRGGIARYSVDHLWLVPHFEKMLYDNAQFIDNLVTAWLATGEELFRVRIEESVEWLLAEMRLPGGGFASSLDADSDGIEGKFYVWSHDEVMSVLGSEDGTYLARFYDIRPEGNWEDTNIPHRLAVPTASQKDENRLARLKNRLLDHRSKRTRPGLDDKVLADWNGLMIAALSRAGRLVSRESWVKHAEEAYDFISAKMISNGRVAHAWRDYRTIKPGFHSDHANMMLAALALSESIPSKAGHYIDQAIAIGAALIEHHEHESGGFYMTADDATDLVIRPVSAIDEATPSGNSQAAEAFFRLYLLTGDARYLEVADRTLIAFSQEIPKNVFGTASLLRTFDTRMHGRTAVIVSPNGTDPNPLLKQIKSAVDPALMAFTIEDGDHLPNTHPAFGKNALDGKPTAYLCREGACSLPIQTKKDLQAALQKIQ